MKYVYLILIICSVFACTKAKKRVRFLEGKWINNRILKDDGSETYPANYYEFETGVVDEKTFLPFTYFGSDTTAGEYLIYNKGQSIILVRDVNSPQNADTCRIDDMDKKMLVLRSVNGVYFLYKQ